MRRHRARMHRVSAPQTRTVTTIHDEGQAASGAASGPRISHEPVPGCAPPPPPGTRCIATEEAFTLPEVTAAASKLFNGVQSVASGPIAGPLVEALEDIGPGRIASMDAAGVDMQLLSITSPGVQIFDAPTGTSLARLVNDRLAEAIERYPSRFSGLAALAPQDPDGAAKELERAVRQLGLKGALINSHTHGEYLSLEKYWPILEAAEALMVPVYLHPREPVPGLAGPLAIPGYLAGWGYTVETATHALSLIGARVFDRFPKLTIVLGHLGESLPFLLDRLDNRYAWVTDFFRMPRAKLLPSEYFRRNFVVTTSGLNYDAPLRAAITALGVDNVLFAIDYPYETQAESVRAMLNFYVSPSDKQKLLETNARRVFKID